MKITNKAKIKYKLLVSPDDIIKAAAESNKAIITLINEFISVLKCKDGLFIKILIQNNSGTNLSNVIVRDSLACDEIFKTNSLTIDGINTPSLNPIEGICLNNLSNRQTVLITYQIINPNSAITNCLISYKFLFNNQYQTVYLINNKKAIQF